jgi:23S rRNA (cytosine1962-C5)-methyltransferase
MYKQVVLKSGRDRSVTNRHPWIFSGAVKNMPDANNGEIVSVHNNTGLLLGYGFFSPHSQITVRLFEFGEQEINIDVAYWAKKITNAYTLRQSVIDFESTNTYRLLHAEGDFLPGIIADVYADTVVLQLLIKGVEFIANDIYAAIRKLGFKYIYLKTKQNTQRLEEVVASGWVGDPKAMPIHVKEYGIEMLIDVETGQKTGFFIDQRENRLMVGNYSKGKRVLNTFSYSGGFSLYALRQGATHVVSVDSSKEAIALCNDNVRLNGYEDKHEGVVMDVFEYMKQADMNFDIIILDPPAFAKNAKALPNATRGYKNLNMAALQRIKSGGLLFTFSCSQHMDKDLFRKVIFGAAAEVGRNVRILQQLTQPQDHPINIYHPEGEYLKGLLLHVE